MEQLDYNLLFRWFVDYRWMRGVGCDVFTKNRDGCWPVRCRQIHDRGTEPGTPSQAAVG